MLIDFLIIIFGIYFTTMIVIGVCIAVSTGSLMIKTIKDFYE